MKITLDEMIKALQELKKMYGGDKRIRLSAGTSYDGCLVLDESSLESERSIDVVVKDDIINLYYNFYEDNLRIDWRDSGSEEYYKNSYEYCSKANENAYIRH